MHQRWGSSPQSDETVHPRFALPWCVGTDTHDRHCFQDSRVCTTFRGIGSRTAFCGTGSKTEYTVLRIPILRKFVLCVHTKSDLFKTLHQARDFLQYVAFPSLEALELDLVGCSGELVQILFYLALMLQRSGAQIEVLKLDMTPVRTCVDAVWKFLQRFPSIQDFAGNGALGDFKELLTRLTANTDQAIILPMLRTLSLHDSIIAGAIPEVVALLLSRSPPDGEDYPPQVSGEGVTEDATTGRPLSRSGTSILSEVRIRKRATSDEFSWAGFLVEEGEVVANLHRRGLVINEQ